jgi:hypothetical protein
MNGIRESRQWGPYGLVGGGAIALAAAIVAASCGGGDGAAPAAATAATIDSAGISGALGDISAFMPICNPAAASARPGPLAVRSFNPVARIQLARERRIIDPGRQRALALTSAKPADVLGSCGGRFGYTDYSHVSGVTSGTLVFTDYCTSDTASGEQTTVNGSISFVDTATPTASGPIDTKIEASSPAGVTAVVRDAGGAVVSSQTVALTGFVYTFGNPGGEPTSASPDRMEAAELKITNNATGKTYRQTGWTITDFTTPSGGEQMSMTGRGYRSSGAYYDISTTTPVVFDGAGNTVSGTLAFSGDAGSNAVVTLVPGAILQATMTVNGEPVPSLPACAK